MAGGCSRKVGKPELQSLLRAGAEASSTTDCSDDSEWVDAFSVVVGEQALVSTADLVYEFGGDPRVLGRAAVCHTLSDVYAVRAKPSFATAVLGVTHEAIADGSAAEVMAGVLQQLALEGVALAGGHTSYSSECFVALTAVGEGRTVDLVSDGIERDVLLLSKPLGSGLAMSAHREGMLDADGIAELAGQLTTSNSVAAETIDMVEQRFGVLAYVTDVTGFGFLDAVRSLTLDGTAHIDSDGIATLACAVAAASEGVASTLLDQNALHADEYTVGLKQHWRALLNDPQTCGGLLVRCTRPMAVELSRRGFNEVGVVVHSSRDGFEIEVK